MEKYQTLGRRFWALVIDSILLSVINGIFAVVFSLVQDSNLILTIIINSLMNTIFVFYFILLHAFYGQTLGKRITGVKVVDDSEAPINFGQSVIRSLPELIPALFAVTVINPQLEFDEATRVIGFVISGAAGIFHIADIIVCLVNDKHRALHDFIAGTIVVRTDV